MNPQAVWCCRMQIITTGHSAYRLQYHVVWVCKYRRRVLNPGVCSYLKKVLLKLCRSMSGVSIETIGFDQDHLHMVMVIPPKYAISDVMGRLKSQSASRLRTKFGFLADVYWKENIVWSPGYFCLLYTSPSPRDRTRSRMPSSA